MRLSAQTLLKIDRTFWLPHKIVQFLFKKLSSLSSSNSGQVIVIKLMGMGSIIRFASLCEEYQVDKKKITMITFHHHKEVCSLFGFQNTIFINGDTFVGFTQDCWKAIKLVIIQKPSAIIDYERCSYATASFSLFLAWLAKCRTVIFEADRNLTGAKISVYNINDLTLEQMFLIGIQKMPTVESERNPMSIPVNSKKIIININASDFLPARRYPIQHFAALIESLHRIDSEYEFILTGSAGEFEYVQQLISSLGEVAVTNQAGKWTLTQLVDNLCDCALFITGDSGPLHLAVYLEVPTIALWGPTQPHHFGYSNKNCLHSVSLQLPCAPCFLHPASQPMVACHGNVDCMTDLAPSVVASKAVSLLRSSKVQRDINFPSGIKVKYSKPELQLAGLA